MIAPSPDHPSASLKKARWFLNGIAAVTVLFGFTVMIGWIAHLPALVRLRPDWPSMQFNTGMCFVLTGLALAAWGRRHRRIVTPLLAGTVALIGGLTLVENLTQTNFGIDQFFFHSPVLPGVVYAGRMSAISALCLVLIGLGLVQLSTPRGLRHPWVAGVLSAIVISTAVNAILGYFLGLPGAYQWGQLTRIAPHTAIGLMILGVALGLASWQISCRPGEHTPRWLPVPLALGVFTGAVVLYFAVEAKQQNELTKTIRTGAASVHREVRLQMENRAHTLARTAHRWEHNGPPTQESWEFDASLYVQDFPDIQAVEWIDPAGLIRWIIPMQDNESKVGLDAARESRRAAAMEQARRERRPIFSGAVTLFRGGIGVIIYVPIQREGGEFEGWIAGVFKVQTFLDRYLPHDVAAGQALLLSDHGQPFYTRDSQSPAPQEFDWISTDRIELPGATWNLRTWPTRKMAARIISPLPITILLVGLFDALLVGGVCLVAQRHSRTSRARAATAAELQRALDEVKTLEGLLPICSSCKRVRDDTGYWNQIDTYLHRHTGAHFSHGYCPECAAKAFEEFGLDIPERVRKDLAARNFE